MIDIKAAREAYNQVMIDDIIWICKPFNLADAMTKETMPPEHVQALESGKIYYEVDQSITWNMSTSKQEKKKVEFGNTATYTRK